MLFLLVGRERCIDLTGLGPLQALVTRCWCGFRQGAVIERDGWDSGGIPGCACTKLRHQAITKLLQSRLFNLPGHQTSGLQRAGCVRAAARVLVSAVPRRNLRLWGQRARVVLDMDKVTSTAAYIESTFRYPASVVLKNLQGALGY